MTNAQAPSAQTGFYDLTGQRGVQGRATSATEPGTPRAVASKSMEPEPEIPAITPDGREAQPATGPEEVELLPTTLDTAEPRAEDVPIPDDNEVLMLKAKARRARARRS